MLDRDTLLRLNGLVQTIGPTTSWHRTAGKLINNHHFAITDNIVDIAMIEHVRPESRIEVVHQTDVAGIVETFTFTNQSGFSEQLLYMLMSILGEMYLLLLLIY